jgi:hypothetical protein
LVSAEKKDGEMETVTVISEKGGVCKIKNPFGIGSYKAKYSWNGTLKSNENILTIVFPKGGRVVLSR